MVFGVNVRRGWRWFLRCCCVVLDIFVYVIGQVVGPPGFGVCLSSVCFAVWLLLWVPEKSSVAPFVSVVHYLGCKLPLASPLYCCPLFNAQAVYEPLSLMRTPFDPIHPRLERSAVIINWWLSLVWVVGAIDVRVVGIVGGGVGLMPWLWVLWLWVRMWMGWWLAMMGLLGLRLLGCCLLREWEITLFRRR